MHWFLLSDITPARRNLTWTPNDIDIFVTGPHGETVELFTRFVSASIKSAQSSGFVIVKEKTHTNRYVVQNQSVTITNVTIKGINTKFSSVLLMLSL